MVQHWAMHTPLSPGGGGKALPLPQRCTLPAHEEATLPCVSCCDCNIIVAVAVPVAIAIAVAILVVVDFAIAIAVGHCRCLCHPPLLLPLAIGHHRHGLHLCRPLGLPLPLDCCWQSCCHRCRPLPMPLPSAIAVVISHCQCHRRWQLP